MYLRFTPYERFTATKKFTFTTNTTLMITDNPPSLNSTVGDDPLYNHIIQRSTRCSGWRCDDVNILRDNSVQSGYYKLLILMNNFSSYAKVNTTIVVNRNDEVETVIDLVTNTGIIIFDVIALVVYVILTIHYKRDDLYTIFSITILVTLLICADPLMITGFFVNYSFVAIVDHVLFQLYFGVFVIYVFFYVDHFKKIALQKEYPKGQWIARIVFIIIYFISFGVYFVFSFDFTDDPISQNAAGEGPKAERSRLVCNFFQFLLMLWVTLYEIFSYPLVQNPKNQKRLMFLIIYSVLTVMLDFIQLSFSNDSHYKLGLLLFL